MIDKLIDNLAAEKYRGRRGALAHRIAYEDALKEHCIPFGQWVIDNVYGGCYYNGNAYDIEHLFEQYINSLNKTV